METIPEVVERISQNIEAKGVTVDREKVRSKLALLVEEFGIQMEEAERTVTNELMREHNLSTPASSGQEERAIANVTPGEWVTVEGKIVSVSEPPSGSIAQSGIIADSSGAAQFVVWAKARAPVLKERTWYRFESAVVDEYRGAPNLKIHSGTKVIELDEDRPLMPSVMPIADLKPGVGSIRAKFIEEWEPRHERMLQTGLLGDESGRIKFVLWKDGDREKLERNRVYTFYYATVDEFNGRLSLNLGTAMYIPEEGDIRVSTGSEEIRGAFVHMGPGSGLVKRCPVEGCNRVLSRQNYCPVHEIQSSFRYDLRIKGVVDDGKKARNVLMQCETVEHLAGISLEQAIEIAENNPLGLDDVLMQLQQSVMGRYLRCRGSDIDGTFLVKECARMQCDASLHAALINRAAASPGGDQA